MSSDSFKNHFLQTLCLQITYANQIILHWLVGWFDAYQPTNQPTNQRFALSSEILLSPDRTLFSTLELSQLRSRVDSFTHPS